MENLDDIARHNRQLWTDWSRAQGVYTQPWLELEKPLLNNFVEGRLEVLPRPYMYIYPSSVLQSVRGKDVLLLASGGGQQSVVYGLLGANVTAVDLTEAQLEADRVAAAHHGYEITTIQADMRDLSCLKVASFDVVYQAISMVFVPDVREVYRQVSRVLRPGGQYRVGHCLAATQAIDETCLRDGDYTFKAPFASGPVKDAEGREFVHLLSDVINGLCELGFHIEGLWEDPRHLHPLDNPEPGTEEHILKEVLKYFAVVTRRAAEDRS